MEDEVDDLQCELVSNASSLCLYHKAVRKFSLESRNKSAMRIRNKRRRGTRRVNYRESVWDRKQSTAGLVITASQSDKEFSKYYKPNYDEMPERLEKTKEQSETQDSRSRVESEQEIFNTSFSKSKRKSSDHK
ncbi:uncharacterized protein LOC126971021 [Leptidea sinapis]|uniref:uncharacterized protein LOC126971021 n=1 Tax=Leptidea sinapis TaxID=189913 RepID=UPI0021C3C9AC|nr:uncharacterized protein LOC126971021 [Leptidea sinapis]